MPPDRPVADLPAAACSGLVRVYRPAFAGPAHRARRPGEGAVRALDRLDLTFPAGKVTVVAGPSGSGKSSLLRILACVDRPTAGSVTVGGVEVAGLGARARRRIRRRLVGLVFQDPADNLLAYLTVREHLELAARLRRIPDRQDWLLDALELAHRAGHRPPELSGGEQQRLAFAAAVVGGPALVVADEPTAELDHAAANRLLDALARLRDAGTSFVVSSHDPTVMDRADHLVRLDRGRLAAAGDPGGRVR